ncbi:MAG: amidohydrolase family protein [Beijerinckiaceae bacterium]
MAARKPKTLLITNAAIVDGTTDRPQGGMHIYVEGDMIREVSAKPITTIASQTIDLKGKTLMPGLIDCHVHVIATMTNLAQNALLPDALVALRAAKIMEGMIMRGFTTVRDVGGGEIGLKMAQQEGLINGPRLVISGKGLSQTNGHADLRGRLDDRPTAWLERRLGCLGRIVDGVDACRKAAREEIKAGADFIKIMANGGVASPTDPIAFLGFSRDEITAIVEEAENSKTYVAAHLYTDEAIRRAVECGVKSVEHSNLIEPDTAALMKKKGAFAVPTVVVYDALANEGASLGLPPDSVAKIETVRKGGMRSLEILSKAGVMMGYGSDLIGMAMHRHQSDEFLIRAKVMKPHEVISHATVNAAKICMMEGRIGTISAGAYADLIVVDGDPLRDLALLTGQGKHMPMIMQGGRMVKNRLR